MPIRQPDQGIPATRALSVTAVLEVTEVMEDSVDRDSEEDMVVVVMADTTRTEIMVEQVSDQTLRIGTYKFHNQIVFI